LAQPATEIPEDDRRNLLYRAIDQHGKVSDVLAGDKRDLTATRRLFTRVLAHARHPVEVTTDRAPASLRVLDELLPAACHVKESTTRTTPSKTIMGDRRHGCDRCVVLNGFAPHE
jgi:transposase-like protein